MHPDLLRIVELIKSRGLFVEMFTNGVTLTSSLLQDLRRAGADMLFLHIEAGQQRPDLSVNASVDELRKIREEKAALVASHDIAVGLAITVYPDRLVELDEALKFSYFIGSVHRNHVVVCQSCLKPTCFERAFLQLCRWLTGKYPFFQSQATLPFMMHLLFNGLAGGGLLRNLRMLASACMPSARLHGKRLLFQQLATVDERGRVIHCHCCPDAAALNGRLAPLCILDNMTLVD